MYKQLIKPLLFSIDPETIHHRVFSLIKASFLLPGARSLARKCFCLDAPELKRTVMGIEFPNPVGLAAGFDKDARLFNELSDLGFGFVEIGTVTPEGQPGNPRPRLFRLPPDEALINRMGFNNQGARAAAGRLRKRRPGLIVGGNIGKNKHTPNDRAVADYLACMEVLYDHVDYFVVNVSSPNTPGLRELQEKGPLTQILQELQRAAAQKARRKPILLKIAPDLNTAQLDDIIEIVLKSGIDGIIATNTTVSRDGLKTPEKALEGIGAGGLSGKPLAARSTEVIRYLAGKAGGAFPIIGAGGIHSPADALEKLEAGASLVQLYTGFIYEGPGLAKRINKAVLRNKTMAESKAADASRQELETGEG